MKVSVFILAYNHERFIGEALQSVLAQRTTFDFEIVVGEDASTDATAHIVRQFQADHPKRIRANLRKSNVGMVRNYVETYQDCRGEYVAYLDGDDYWIDSEKLRKQVEFLDGHPECAMCAHNVLVTTEGGEPPKVLGEPYGRGVIGLADIIMANFVPSCSVMARNRLIPRFPDWLEEMAGCDWVFSMLNARHGQVGYLNEAMAVYRKHPAGCWSSMPAVDQLREVLRIYEKLPTVLPPEYAPIVELATRWANSAYHLCRLEAAYRQLETHCRALESIRGSRFLELLRRCARPAVRLVRGAHLRRALARPHDAA